MADPLLGPWCGQALIHFPFAPNHRLSSSTCLTLPRSCSRSPSLSRYVSAISLLCGLCVHSLARHVYQHARVCAPVSVSVRECEEEAVQPRARVTGAAHRQALLVTEMPLAAQMEATAEWGTPTAQHNPRGQRSGF